ncbi:phosphopantetheine-binding protein, partial [Noviherbaspirillum sp. CPCC 100848]
RRNALGEEEIVAYLVGQDCADPAQLRAQLAACLPAPMVPSRFMSLPALPQTPNGKTDRRALPEPLQNQEKQEKQAKRGPASADEAALAGIFSEVLGNVVGAEDDFFLAGGESIRALRLATRIRAAGFVFDVQDLFRWPTPAALAANLAKTKDSAAGGGDAIGKLSGLSGAELADLFS